MEHTKLRRRAISGKASTIAIGVLDVIDPDWREDLRQKRWRETLDEVERWWKREGRLPSRKGASPEERRYGRWLGTQRRDATGAGAGAESFIRNGRGVDLDERLPGWGPRIRPAWDERLAELESWLLANPGELPSESSGEGAERSLCVWLTRQRGDNAEGLLDADRKRRLNKVLPGWQNSSLARWKLRLNDLVEFCATHGRMPSRNSDSAAERSLNAWLAQQRKLDRHADATFAAERRGALLDDAVPGWRGGASPAR